MNRRGIVDDMILWLALVVMAGLSFIIVFIILDGISTGINESGQFTSKEKGFISGYTNNFSTVWDYTFLTVFVTGIIGLLIITWFLQSNPGLFFAVWFVVVILGIVAAALSNGIETAITGSSVLSAASGSFPITTWILEHLVGFTVGGAFLMLLVFFGKPGGEPV